MFNSAMTPAPLHQHIYFTNALQAAGINAFYHKCGVQMIRKGPVLYGSGIAGNALFAALRNTPDCAIIIINTDNPTARPAGFRQIMTPASVAEIDLTRPLQMHVKWRNALQKAQNSPLKTCHRAFDMKKDNWLFAADLAQQKIKKFRGMPHAIVQNWPEHDTMLSVATLHGSPVAAMLFLGHGVAATYQIGWSNSSGRMHNAHQLLLSQAVNKLHDTGYLRLDLGTVDTHNAIDLARFKLRAGATLRQLGGTWIALRKWGR